jgi:hypothetical protein
MRAQSLCKQMSGFSHEALGVPDHLVRIFHGIRNLCESGCTFLQRVTEKFKCLSHGAFIYAGLCDEVEAAAAKEEEYEIMNFVFPEWTFEYRKTSLHLEDQSAASTCDYAPMADTKAISKT